MTDLFNKYAYISRPGGSCNREVGHRMRLECQWTYCFLGVLWIEQSQLDQTAHEFTTTSNLGLGSDHNRPTG